MNSTVTSRIAPSRVGVPGAIVGTLLTVSAPGASPPVVELRGQLSDVVIHLESAASSRRNRQLERFGRLVRQWREDTQWLSSTTEIAMHPAYQAVIGMGPDALPMILEDLRNNSGYWYWALKAISNEDPVPPSDRGAIKKMKNAWIQWGKQRRILAE